MSRLPIGLPEVHQQFMQGSFNVQFGRQNPFGRIHVDQNIEDTVNRDTQTAGGTEGFSLIGLLWRGITSLVSTAACT